jgi:hypothetical protein
MRHTVFLVVLVTVILMCATDALAGDLDGRWIVGWDARLDGEFSRQGGVEIDLVQHGLHFRGTALAPGADGRPSRFEGVIHPGRKVVLEIREHKDGYVSTCTGWLDDGKVTGVYHDTNGASGEFEMVRSPSPPQAEDGQPSEKEEVP